MRPTEMDNQKGQLNALAVATIMPAYFGIINVVLYTFGLAGITSFVTALIYISILIYIIVKTTIFVKDLSCLLVVYAVFFLNYVLFPSTRSEMLSQGMIILYLFFLPYSILCFKNISCWEEFWWRIRPHSIAVVYLGALMMIFLPYSDHLDYMDFSYGILPAICALIYFSQTTCEKRMFFNISAIIGIIEILAFGARAPAAYCFIFFAGLLLFNGFSGGIKKKVLTIGLLLLGLIFFFEFNSFLRVISRISFFENSYIIRRFISGNLIQSSSRELIWKSCIARLSTMGGYVGGFYGDRKYCGGVYPHNIGLEILMSWGWFFGTMILIGIIVLFVKSLKTNGVYRDVTWFFIMTCFSRYMLSGTYVREGKFWISIFVLYAVAKSYKNNSNSIETNGCH